MGSPEDTAPPSAPGPEYSRGGKRNAKDRQTSIRKRTRATWEKKGNLREKNVQSVDIYAQKGDHI